MVFQRGSGTASFGTRYADFTPSLNRVESLRFPPQASTSFFRLFVLKSVCVCLWFSSDTMAARRTARKQLPLLVTGRIRLYSWKEFCSEMLITALIYLQIQVPNTLMEKKNSYNKFGTSSGFSRFCPFSSRATSEVSSVSSLGTWCASTP